MSDPTTKTIKACPECDCSRLYHRQPKARGPGSEPGYVCDECGHRFTNAVERDSHTGCNAGHGLARRLEQADPDEVGRD
jgi:hypothetical protein